MADPWAQFPDAPQVAPAPADPWAQFPDAAPAPPAPRPPAAVQAEYEGMPWYQQAGQAADDVVRLIANGLTFGYADKLAGAMGGAGTEAERARTQEARDRAGLAGTVAEIGGGVAVPVGAAGQGITLAGRLGTGAMKGVGGLAARSGLAGAEGAGYGALTAAGNDHDLSDGALLGAIFGAGGNAAAEGIGKVVSGTAGLFNKPPKIPTADELRQSADAAYKAAENAGVIYTPAAVDRLKQRVVQELFDFGYDPALQPGAAAVIRRLDDLTGQNVSLKGLDTVRRVASKGYVQGNDGNNEAVRKIIAAIDDVVGNTQPGDILAGNAPAAAAAIQDARRTWSQLAKATTVDDILNSAELRTASTGKGGNIDNATRQNLRRVLEKPRGYTPDEIEALDAAVRGTPTQNFLRSLGGFAPTGVVSGGIGITVGSQLGSMFGPGGSMAGAVAVPAIGQAAKWTADAMTKSRAQDLLDIILAGGSRAATQAEPNAVQRAAAASRDDLARIIMQGGNVEANR